VFTLECASTGDWRLGPSVRYAHSEAYVRRVAAQTGWNVITVEGFAFRREQEGWTPGWLVELSR
jgi:predicted TPR repeat methyltransferase